MKISSESTAYLWFDTEYTGLDIDDAALLQVALVITDAQLKRIAPKEQDLSLFVRLPQDRKVSPWIEENMPDILNTCRSERALDVGRVDEQLFQYVTKTVTVPGGDDKKRPILAGNSIHADWFLARKFLPQFMSLVHYRQLDVTALKLQWQDWFKGEAFEKDKISLIREYFPEAVLPDDGKPHDAYYDVQASIAELNFYRQRLT
ncbi:MAG TPA: exonuclease domain-containing protein [Kiritimatiellia bacterium]